MATHINYLIGSILVCVLQPPTLIMLNMLKDSTIWMFHRGNQWLTWGGGGLPYKRHTFARRQPENPTLSWTIWGKLITLRGTNSSVCPLWSDWVLDISSQWPSSNIYDCVCDSGSQWLFSVSWLTFLTLTANDCLLFSNWVHGRNSQWLSSTIGLFLTSDIL